MNELQSLIDAIKSFNIPLKFNEQSRLLFEKKYCFNAVISRYAEVLDTPTPKQL